MENNKFDIWDVNQRMLIGYSIFIIVSLLLYIVFYT